jgi:hypothetical protein
MAEYIDALPSGSYVAISHFLDPENEYTAIAKRLEQIFVHSPLGSGWFRLRAEILELFNGLELVEPGLARCVDWWPDGHGSRSWSQRSTASSGASAANPEPRFTLTWTTATS